MKRCGILATKSTQLDLGRNVAKTRLGIVTISFNQAPYLREAIESVAVSELSRLSYVIADPGSTDGSRAIIDEYRNRFSEVVLKKDRGPADGLNNGFAVCDADVFGYLNSDDRFCRGALDYVLDYFDANPAVDVLLGGIRIIDAEGKVGRRGRAADIFDPLAFSVGACFAWQQATFFRRRMFEKVGGFRTESNANWDGELVFEMALAGAQFGYTERALGDFRIYPASITGSQRLSDGYRRDMEYVRDRLRTVRGVKVSRVEGSLRRGMYRLNVVRHLRAIRMA